jgi:hypothetical protein
LRLDVGVCRRAGIATLFRARPARRAPVKAISSDHVTQSTEKMKSFRSLVLICMLLCLPALDAIASTFTEQVMCTNEPRGKWMSEEKIKAIFGADKYMLVKFKVSRTNCYEFYALAHSGQIVEAYYHPITGALVKENRMLPPSEPARAVAVPQRK